ncbi:hypothetical protein [Paenibacillus sonchi]|uniref:hypothetical protein n=1 Tax=Paenibacillus sonchi TaxID=373687 RepID=UPI001E351AF4|nr:hypothetical protein [Paenibacillus sonchi]MCE3202315.1 hypothetical protein [Paenibacillus sonchi]
MGLEKTLDDIERKGIELGKEEIAGRMIAEGMDDQLIAKITGFSLKKVEQLRKQIQ